MTKIRSRADLLDFAQESIGSRACGRAFDTGEVSLLGGFCPVAPTRYDGWIITVRSVAGRLWIIGVLADDARHTYRMVELDRIPWKKWNLGDRGGIYAGDVPAQAQHSRSTANG